jgi:hypothetical protein
MLISHSDFHRSLNEWAAAMKGFSVLSLYLHLLMAILNVLLLSPFLQRTYFHREQERLISILLPAKLTNSTMSVLKISWKGSKANGSS